VNRFSRHELFGGSERPAVTEQPPVPGQPVVPERPVQSDYVVRTAPNYALRRLITVSVLAIAVAAGFYFLWPSTPSDPADIPTIKAEGEYKQKPTEPGGIDIPHQDVRVYDQLEGKGAAAPVVEHLLPPAETPKEEAKETVKEEAKEAAKAAPEALPAPVVAKPAADAKTDILQKTTAKPVETTVEKVVEKPTEKAVEQAEPATSTSFVEPVASEPAKAPVAVAPAKTVEKPKAETPLSMEKVIEKVTAKAAPIPAGMVVAQLASSPNESQAHVLMENLQKKYATQMGSTNLRIVRADLGSRGIFYRIQTEPLAKDEAGRLCSSLKKLNAGCILVGK